MLTICMSMLQKLYSNVEYKLPEWPDWSNEMGNYEQGAWWCLALMFKEQMCRVRRSLEGLRRWFQAGHVALSFKYLQHRLTVLPKLLHATVRRLPC